MTPDTEQRAGDTGEDERGRELAQRSSPIDQHGAKPLDPSEQTKLDQIGAGLNSGTTASASSASAAPVGNRLTGALKGAGSFVGSHKRGAAIGGGIAGFIFATVFAFIALLPLKLVSLMSNIVRKEGARVEYAIERREERIAITYLAQRAGVNVGSGVVVEGTPLGTLYANWAKQKFEQKLLTNQGIKVEKGSSNGRLKITAGDSTKPVDTTLEKFLGQDLNSSDARRFIRAAVDSETHTMQFIKRRHLRRWLRNAAGVRKWSVFDRKTGKAATTELDTALADAEVGPLLNELPADENCALEGKDCPSDSNTRAEVDGTDPARPTINVDQTTNTCGQNDKACQDALKDPANADQKGAVRTALDKVTGNISDILEKEITKKIIAAGVGLGALNLMADLDNGLWNNTFGKMIQMRRTIQYADTFSIWMTIVDQIKNGQTVSGDETNAAMQKLTGIEQGQAFSCIYENNCSKGTPMDPQKKIGSGGGEGVANTIAQAYKDSIGAFLHPILSAYKATVGGILGAISGILGGVLNNVIKYIPGITTLEKFVSQYLGDLLNWVLGTVVDGTEVGAALVNAIDAGADATYNLFARDTLGAPLMSSQSAAQMNTTIATNYRANQSHLPLFSRLFSTSNEMSLVNQLAVYVPSSPSQAATAAGSYVASIISRPTQLFSSLFQTTLLRPAFAATTVDPYGMDQYGYSESELDQPLQAPIKDIAGPPGPDGKRTGPDGIINEYDCPVITDATQPNLCLLDIAAVQGMTASTDGNDDGGISSP